MMFTFRPKTQDEEQKIAQRAKEIKEATQQAEESLFECLRSDTFIKYRKDLETSYKRLIEIGVEILKVKNINERVALYDALFVRAEVLGVLMKRIEDERG